MTPEQLADEAFEKARGGNIHLWTKKADDDEVKYWKEVWMKGFAEAKRESVGGSLLGKRFRRNKYGLSMWFDYIVDIDIQRRFIDKNHFSPLFIVKGAGGHWYPLSEILIVMEAKGIALMELQKKERHDNIRRGIFPKW